VTLTRDTALALLEAHGRGGAWMCHCRAVAEHAAVLGRALARRHSVDHDFLWRAALLHDIGRSVTHDPVGHGVEGHKLLSGLGFEREAQLCASHVLFGLEACEAAQFGLPERAHLPEGLEERIVTLVDFLVEHTRPTTLHQRFESLKQRNADNPFFSGRLDRAQERARGFMRWVEGELGESVEELLARHGAVS
jgi:uncharacterized protein